MTLCATVGTCDAGEVLLGVEALLDEEVAHELLVRQRLQRTALPPHTHKPTHARKHTRTDTSSVPSCSSLPRSPAPLPAFRSGLPPPISLTPHSLPLLAPPRTLYRNCAARTHRLGAHEDHGLGEVLDVGQHLPHTHTHTRHVPCPRGARPTALDTIHTQARSRLATCPGHIARGKGNGE
eukprot:1383346-Rhodomonas_salina.1